MLRLFAFRVLVCLLVFPCEGLLADTDTDFELRVLKRGYAESDDLELTLRKQALTTDAAKSFLVDVKDLLPLLEAMIDTLVKDQPEKFELVASSFWYDSDLHARCLLFSPEIMSRLETALKNIPAASDLSRSHIAGTMRLLVRAYRKDKKLETEDNPYVRRRGAHNQPSRNMIDNIVDAAAHIAQYRGWEDIASALYNNSGNPFLAYQAMKRGNESLLKRMANDRVVPKLSMVFGSRTLREAILQLKGPTDLVSTLKRWLSEQIGVDLGAWLSLFKSVSEKGRPQELFEQFLKLDPKKILHDAVRDLDYVAIELLFELFPEYNVSGLLLDWPSSPSVLDRALTVTHDQELQKTYDAERLRLVKAIGGLLLRGASMKPYLSSEKSSAAEAYRSMQRLLSAAFAGESPLRVSKRSSPRHNSVPVESDDF